MKIRELIKKEAIKLGASPKTKEEAIDELVALHVAAGNVADAAAYKEAILKRESEGSTGMRALSARAPWPISRLPGPLLGFVSPTE